MPHTTPPHQPPQTPPPCFSKTTNFPDFLLTALSLVLFITTPKHHHITPRATSISSQSSQTHRRFLRLTSSTMTTSPTRNSRLFPTPQSLSDWLQPRLPSDSFATWGTLPGTKNVHNLWLEIEDGEISIVDKVPPVRNLEVVCVKIMNQWGKQLIEAKQELSDGSIRIRNRALSEKLKAGEDIETGAKRAIKEELGSLIFETKKVDLEKRVRIMMESYEKKVEERNSVSYPGLPARYVLHNVDAVVEGLPDEEFVTEEGSEYERGDQGGAVTVKRHFWKWVEAEFG